MAYIRNPAFRVCSDELKNMTVKIEKEQGADKYTSQFFLTPTGAKVSRVAMFGVIVEKEDIGEDQPFWRARMTDQTGGVFLYAGNYQPECSQIIARASVPSYVMVIGKPSIYTPEEGKGSIVSVRPDTIVFITEAARMKGDKEVLEFTRARVKLLESDVNLKKLITEKYPDHISTNKAMIDAMEKAYEQPAQSSSFSADPSTAEVPQVNEPEPDPQPPASAASAAPLDGKAAFAAKVAASSAKANAEKAKSAAAADLPFDDETVIAGSMQQIGRTAASTMEAMAAIILYWCKQDEVQAKRCLAGVVARIKSNNKTDAPKVPATSATIAAAAAPAPAPVTASAPPAPGSKAPKVEASKPPENPEKPKKPRASRAKAKVAPEDKKTDTVEKPEKLEFDVAPGVRTLISYAKKASAGRTPVGRDLTIDKKSIEKCLFEDGITTFDLDGAIKEAMDTGFCYEPVLGVLSFP